jgi:hypothetical protein
MNGHRRNKERNGEKMRRKVDINLCEIISGK